MIFDASSLYILLTRKDLSPLRNSLTLDLAFYEVGNALVKDLRGGSLTDESFSRAVQAIGNLSQLIEIVNFDRLEPDRIAEFCKSSGLTFYDSSYLTLASISKDVLVTNDEDLAKKARKIGVRTTRV